MHLLAVQIPNAVAQRTDVQSWTLATATINLDSEKRWFIYAEAQPRLGDDISRLERLLLRPAVGVNVNEHVALFLGYAWTPTFSDGNYRSDFRNENRIWQQVVVNHSLFSLDWQHRLRQEQRVIEDAGDTSHRTRYLIRGSQYFPSSRLAGLTGYNELFITNHGTQRGPKGGFDRDRFFFGPFVKVGTARYEIGYLGEYSPEFGGSARMINALMLGVNFTL